MAQDQTIIVGAAPPAFRRRTISTATGPCWKERPTREGGRRASSRTASRSITRGTSSSPTTSTPRRCSTCSWARTSTTSSAKPGSTRRTPSRCTPIRANAFGLPDEVLQENILGRSRRTWKYPDNYKPRHFRDWMNTFGQGIANNFLVPYNQKLWKGVALEDISVWLGGRVPQPSVEQIIDGAINIPKRAWAPTPLRLPAPGRLQRHHQRAGRASGRPGAAHQQRK